MGNQGDTVSSDGDRDDSDGGQSGRTVFRQYTRAGDHLLRQGDRTVEKLAQALGLTDNAVRAHLATLERDGLVRQAGLRRGTSKQAYAHALTPAAERLFPKAYGTLLRMLLDALTERLRLSAVARRGASRGRRSDSAEWRVARSGRSGTGGPERARRSRRSRGGGGRIYHPGRQLPPRGGSSRPSRDLSSRRNAPQRSDRRPRCRVLPARRPPPLLLCGAGIHRDAPVITSSGP